MSVITAVGTGKAPIVPHLTHHTATVHVAVLHVSVCVCVCVCDGSWSDFVD